MLSIKLIYKSLLDNHIKLMRQISEVIIIFFYFVISTNAIVFLAPKSPENASFAASMNSLGAYVIFLFISIFTVLFPIKIEKPIKNVISNNQMFFIEYFPTLPMFISSVGFSFMFIGGLLKNLLLTNIGLIIFTVGLFLVSMMVIIKGNFERQIYYSINGARDNLITIDDKNNSYKVKKFTKFIMLTLDNLNMKLGRKLKINASELGIFHIDAILSDYLPYYIKLGNETQLESLKKHIETMSNSVDKSGYVDLKVFNNELVQLSKDIIKFLKDNNLRIVPRFSIFNFFRDIDNIKNIGAILFYLIITLLTIVYFFKYGKLPEAIIK